MERICLHRERQIGKKRNKVQRSYLVKWLSYGNEHNSWEPEANLNFACLQEYWDTIKLHSKGSSKARTGTAAAMPKSTEVLR